MNFKLFYKVLLYIFKRKLPSKNYNNNKYYCKKVFENHTGSFKLKEP